MRLIDADKMIEEIRKWYWDKVKQEAAKKDVSPMDLFTNLAIITVKNQPTAFETEKVIKQLEEESEQSYVDFESYAKEHNMGSGFNDWHYKGLNRAIEIIKRGGRDEE